MHKTQIFRNAFILSYHSFTTIVFKFDFEYSRKIISPKKYVFLYWVYEIKIQRI